MFVAVKEHYGMTSITIEIKRFMEDLVLLMPYRYAHAVQGMLDTNYLKLDFGFRPRDNLSFNTSRCLGLILFATAKVKTSVR